MPVCVLLVIQNCRNQAIKVAKGDFLCFPYVASSYLLCKIVVSIDQAIKAT